MDASATMLFPDHNLRFLLKSRAAATFFVHLHSSTKNVLVVTGLGIATMRVRKHGV